MSPAWKFRARSQEVASRSTPRSSRVAAGKVIAGQPFVVTADTTPALRGAGLDLTPPVFPGRTVTLQRRVDGDQWSTVATGATDRCGVATFSLIEPTVGTQVYRVRQEDWFDGDNQIGWSASFPTYVDVVSALGRSGHAAATGHAPRTDRARDAARTDQRGQGPGPRRSSAAPRPTPARPTGGGGPCSTSPGSTASP